MPQPDVRAGIEYWKSQPASLDGVLGGYGSGVPVLYFTYQKLQLTLRVGNSLCQGSIPSVQDYFYSIFTLSYPLFHLHYVH